MRPIVACLLLSIAAGSVACDEEAPPPAGAPDSGVLPADGGKPPEDLGLADAGLGDSGAEDTGSDDTGVDSGMPDQGQPDTGPIDQGMPDAGPIDQGLPDMGTPDMGSPDLGTPDSGIHDQDGDTILDQHEGNGAVDTDGDGTPDSADTDSDGDGISDRDEAGDGDLSTPPIDTDGDGTPDFQDLDADGDGIADVVEGLADTDGDGTPDYLDLDSDGDGLPDQLETDVDTDLDGIRDFRDLDSDGDTIRDDQDGTQDTDNDGTPNFRDSDSDSDGIRDEVEAGDATLGTPPNDTDGDGSPDFMDLDADGDTILDSDEGAVDTDGDGIPDFADIDSDGDTLFDADEAGDADLNTAPRDTDMDGSPDFQDVDSDGDTIADLEERGGDRDGDGLGNAIDLDSDGDGVPDRAEAGDTDLTTAAVDTDGDRLPDYLDLDSDGDGLADGSESGCPVSTNRTAADSDGDGFVDPAEVAYGSDPCNGASVIDDFYFVLPPSTPPVTDVLDFTNTQIDNADLAINMDTTQSMSEEIGNLRSSLSSFIIPAVRSVVPGAAFGVSSFEDFPLSPFGNSSDLPFRLGTRITTDGSSAQFAVNRLSVRSGGDFPEAGHTSLHRLATGTAITWPNGSVAAFDSNAGRIVGVADGDIGGAGFRQDALPIIVHVTDAVSHTSQDYAARNVTTPTARQVKDALNAVGARVITASSMGRPFVDQLCAGEIINFFGGIESRRSDVDWFRLSGVSAGDWVRVDVLARAFDSTLNPMVAVANATQILARNDDIAPGNPDASVVAPLSGNGPYYVGITRSGDFNFTGAAAGPGGHYIAAVQVDGAAGVTAFMPNPTACRADDGDARGGATVLVAQAAASAPTDQAACQAQCSQILGDYYPLFADFTFPVELSEGTGAVVPTCAWSAFGGGRPFGCGANQCCTGQNGAGVPPNADGMCPLSFEVAANGVGLDQAMVSGIEALVGFSTFDLTTDVRGDPNAAGGIDTTCFIQSVVPVRAVPPNSCAPTPTAVDHRPPQGQNDTWLGATPGTRLEFDVEAANDDGTGQPCVGRTVQPQLFRAFIDVIADGVTVLDTREVIIIVPPQPPGGSN